MHYRIVEVVDRGRDEIKQGDGPPLLTAEGIVGGALSLIHARMVEDTDSSEDTDSPLVEEADVPLIELLGPLMSMVVLPYLGSTAARRELALPVPSAINGADGSVPGDPLRGLDMRLTYRTIRVLLAVAELSGQGSDPSNRQISDAAGIRDQGQISKLLSRLEHLGLVRNASGRHVKGEPNSWTLTERGANLREVVSL